MTEQESAHPVNSVQDQSQMITNHTLENMSTKEDISDNIFSEQTRPDGVLSKSKSMVSKSVSK